MRRHAKGLAEDGLDFHGALFVKVDFHAGAVGCHVVGVVEHELDEGLIDGSAAGAGAGDDFVHELANELSAVGVGHELVGGGVEGDGQPVVGDVPDEFLPSRQEQVVGEFDGQAGAEEVVADGVEGGGDARHAGEAGGLEVSESDFAVVEVPDVAGAEFIDADEAEPAEDAVGAGDGGGLFFDAHAVLHHEDEGAGAEHRRQQLREQVVVGGLEGDDDDIARRDVGGVAVDVGSGQGEVALGGFDGQAMTADMVVVGVEEEVDVQAGVGESGAVVGAQGAGAEDGVRAWGHVMTIAQGRACVGVWKRGDDERRAGL